MEVFLVIMISLTMSHFNNNAIFRARFALHSWDRRAFSVVETEKSKPKNSMFLSRRIDNINDLQLLFGKIAIRFFGEKKSVIFESNLEQMSLDSTKHGSWWRINKNITDWCCWNISTLVPSAYQSQVLNLFYLW